MKYWFLLLVLLFDTCNQTSEKKNTPTTKEVSSSTNPSLYILGTVQDAGSPHIACKKDCCAQLFKNPDAQRKVVSLGVVDHANGKSYLFEATPDMPSQLKSLKAFSGKSSETPDGVFLTHAHIGHYVGLMYLGREALNANRVPVYAMPKMKDFLGNNGPWDQLVGLENIIIEEIQNEHPIVLTPLLSVVPFTVPHRDEYSETVGYKIIGPNKTALFIPDIDKWHKWEKSIIEEISNVEYAFLDATFFDGDEINNRDISEIPHPFVIESMELFKNLPASERAKIHFIHFNHTNPLLNEGGNLWNSVVDQGFKVASFHQKIDL